MSKPITCGIIGSGVIAPLHAKCYRNLNDVTLRWACDLEPEKADKLADAFNIPLRTVDYQDVLRDPEVDAVSICTDHASHAQIAVDAMRAGKHVLCEKALAAHPAELDAMLEEYHKHSNLVCGGIFQHRFNSKNRYLKQLVEDGFFGTALLVSLKVHCLRTHEYYESAEWRGTEKFEGGGVLINQAIHFIDAMLFAVGPVTEVSATVENRTHANVIDVEDTAVATLRFANGSLGVLEASSSTEHSTWSNRLTVTGSDAMIELRNESLHDLIGIAEERADAIRKDFSALEEDRPIEGTKSYYGSGHAGQIKDFIEAIRSGRRPEVTLESAAQAVRVVHAIYEASKTKRWVSVTIGKREG